MTDLNLSDSTSFSVGDKIVARNKPSTWWRRLWWWTLRRFGRDKPLTVVAVDRAASTITVERK